MLLKGFFSIMQIFVNTSEIIIHYKKHCTMEGCGRTPNKPQHSTASPLDSHITTEIPTHRHPCTDAEVKIAKCFNGGECYALEIHENRSVNCLCPKLYRGSRCEEISPDIFGELQTGGKVVIGGVAAGVCVIILIIVIVIVYYVIKIRKKRREERSHRNENGVQGETLLQQNIINHNHTKNGIHNKETNV
ncbi:hypothetical protein LOTGIDRAFT_154532 [Lottia gigantea]|uniref:EGF-like domain-containing protein n=1 Tax=Lottia gigantea TaxID=225164 RepID=V3ZRS8_LOTGI|nr:hypothetical protein LOTGIDRAFT_154532 [Lottia gigantea]ESO87047.1 hypothetical protein LOTGIDRAFT_154532 [Lottia gigantea]